MTRLGRLAQSTLLATALGLPATPGSAQQIDTARALSALRDARSACEADHGALWKRSLCGPIALVDRQTRLVIANDTIPGRHFIRLDDAFVTILCENQYVANTSFLWGARPSGAPTVCPYIPDVVWPTIWPSRQIGSVW